MTVQIQIIPSLGISSMTKSKFDDFIFDKITNLTGNSNFPVTTPPIADVKTKYDLFHPLQVAGRNLNNTQRTLRDSLYDGLYSQITSLAWDCSTRSGIDKVKYSTSGFGFRKEGVPYNDLLPSPTGSAANTKKGEGRVEVLSDKMAYCKNFITRYGIAGTDPSTWKSEVGERVQMLTGLNPGDKMEMQRAGNGKKGTGFYCTKVTFTVPFD